VIDLCALPYLLRSFPRSSPSGRPGRLVPVGFDCASWKRAVSTSLAHPQLETWVRVRSGVWPGLLVGEAVRRRARVGGEAFWSERRARVRSGRHSSSARPFGRLGFWAGPGVVRRSQRRLLGRAFVGKPVYEGPRIYEPDKR